MIDGNIITEFFHFDVHQLLFPKTDLRIISFDFNVFNTNIEKIRFEQKITEKKYPIEKLDYKNSHRKSDFILKFESDTKKS